MSRFSGQNRPSPTLGANDPRQRRPLPPEQTLAEPMKLDRQGKLTVDTDWKGWQDVAQRPREYWPLFLTMGA